MKVEPILGELWDLPRKYPLLDILGVGEKDGSQQPTTTSSSSKQQPAAAAATSREHTHTVSPRSCLQKTNKTTKHNTTTHNIDLTKQQGARRE
jgi:hypothetical protein